MPRFLDLLYLIALALLSPWLAWRVFATGRYRRDLAGKMLGRVRIANPQQQRVAWFHAVSVGEVNLLGTLVPAFRKEHLNWLIVVSSTTETGLAEARRRFSELTVIAWPFDFSWAVAATLDAVKPDVVVLTESEMWPNFLTAAKKRDIPVVLVNARMSPRSFRRLQRVAGLARSLLFAKVTRFAVQDQDYADRFQHLGVPAAKLSVTGSIKYDGALRTRDTQATRRLREQFQLANDGASRRYPPTIVEPDEKSPVVRSPLPLILLAGSTHAPEEAILLDVFARLRASVPGLHLILVPRHPDRFEEVARLVERSGLPMLRRSRIGTALCEMPAVLLLDTIGELGAAWGLADVGFTGGSLDGQRGGQSMIEPAGYGVPCVFGPHIWNFKDAAKRLVESGGAIMVPDAAGLERELTRLLADAELREHMGIAARELVQRQQGATHRTLNEIAFVLLQKIVHRNAA